MEPTRPNVPAGKFRTLQKFLIAAVVTYLAFSILAGIVIADLSLKLHRLPLRHRQAVAATVQRDFHAELQDASIIAADGAVLTERY